MASDHVIEFTDGNFEAEAIQASQPVLVDFWAEWCMPCRMLAPVIDELASDFDGKAKVGKVDTDANRETAMKYQISAIPTVIILKDGEVHKRFTGITTKEELEAALTEAAG